MADKTYPRIPASNWWALRAQFAKTLPSAVTTTYLQTLLGLNAESAKNLVSPLRQLGLIDDDGKPTARANDWRTDAKYDIVCERMVQENYPQELRDLFRGPEVDRNACKEWFMHTAKLGDAGATSVTSMYILLNSGLATGREEPRKRKDVGKDPSPKVKTATTSTMKAAAVATTNNFSAPAEAPAVSAVAPKSVHEAPTLHIDLQIHIAPDASADQIEVIFASMAKHLYRKHEA